MKISFLKKTFILLPLMMFFLISQTVFGQESKNHKIYFDNIDGFSGYVEITTKYINSPTRIHAYDKGLVLNRYNTNRENLEVLLNAGYDLRGMINSGVTPPDYGYEVTGKAYIVSTNTHNALAESKFHLSNGMNDYRTIDFDENTKQAAKEWGKNNSKVTYWEEYGGFDNPKVVKLYLTDFKNEIDRILGKHENEKRQFAQLIAQATSSANQYNFPVAESALSNALSLVGDNRDMKNEVDKVTQLIADKKAEKEKQEAEEKEKEKENEELNDLLSDAQSALWQGDLETAKTLLEKAYKMDPQNEMLNELSNLYKKMVRQQDEKELNEKIIEAEINQKILAAQRGRDETEELALLRSWNAYGSDNLSAYSQSRLKELTEKETQKKVNDIRNSFEQNNQLREEAHLKKMAEIDRRHAEREEEWQEKRERDEKERQI
ncbi:MAG TPA: hypothetical protein VFD80_01960, partial [Flavobacteriaceae bacterium]|nr:hypothetical protein [Flavobacteriaceae bacterium]